jgi:pimeloyl-ACP methyl ester carboxylesterase
VDVEEHTIELGGAPVFYRTAGAGSGARGARPEPGARPAPEPVLYLHGSPTSSDDWVEMLARTGGIAPDLPGFGRTTKAGNLDYSLNGHADFIEWLLSELHVDRVKLVAHDWGAGGGLVFAQRHPERVAKLALVDALPLMPEFEYGRVGKVWRVPALGEFAVGSVTRGLMKRALKRATANPEVWTPERLATIYNQFDQGTQRAVLRLHRAAGPHQLAAAGLELGELNMPALILWGELDRWFEPRWAEAYGERLTHATVRRIPDAGHWPWLERPEAADALAEFLA